ncbi:hypothetical protein ACHAQA_004060 [Verticillium albo-atrum]
MMLLALAAIWLSLGHIVDAKAVFAHFMTQNAASFKIPQWEAQIQLAKDAHIDGFALNIVWPWEDLMTQLSYAFTAANNKGFKMIFSFDYAASDPELGFPKDKVIELLKIYGPNGGYFKHSTGQPLASTFEGPSWYNDWPDIKKQTDAFFIPSYSSLGARRAMTTGVVDGLFNWGGWPEGPNNLNTVIDASYKEFLNGKAYMMPVSPWFYTNMPGFHGKNWLWRGDSLWSDRWNHVWFRDPEYVQIVTWNDFGESHYIGPLDETQYEAFDRGNAPYNYVRGMPHDGWRLLLPYVIDTYKNGVATINRELLVGWYRLTPARTCGTGGTTGNTAQQMQTEYHPADVVQDKIFFSALLGSDATVSVTIGGSAASDATWTRKPKGGIGIYQGTASFGGKTGQVIITVNRGAAVVARMTGQSITTACTNPGGLSNFNAWVGSAQGPDIAATPLPLSKQNCTEGFGAGNYDALCKYSCKYGYCPEVCTCSAMGTLLAAPTPKNRDGFPQPGSLCGFKGLCAFGCNYDLCPAEHCTVDPAAKDKCAMPPEAPVEPIPPPGSGSNGGLPDDGCRKGTGPGNIEGLCDFSCYYGYCPSACTCLSRDGPANKRPARVAKHGFAIEGMGMEYTGLCNFTVMHNYIAPAACTNDFSKASDLYTAMPADVGLPTSARRRSDVNDTSIALLERQIAPQPDLYEGLDPYWQMTEQYIEKRYCGLGGEVPFQCLGIGKEAHKNYCDLKNGVKSGYDKWKEMNGLIAGRYIIRTYMRANGDADWDPVPPELQLSGTYKDNFLQTITAMWGGRDGMDGFHVAGSQWNCGSDGAPKCDVAIVPGFVAFAVQLRYINAYFNDMHEALVQVNLNLMETFKEEKEDILAILLAVAGALGVVGMVGLAGGMLATLGAAAGTVGGALGGAVGAYQALNPDEKEGGSLKGELESAADLNRMVNVLTRRLQKNIENLLTSIFSGADPGAFALEELVKEGQFTSQGYDKAKFVQPLEEALVARLLPAIWKTRHRASPAFVLIPGLNAPFPREHLFEGGDINDYRRNFWAINSDGTTSHEHTGYLIDVRTCANPSGNCTGRYKALPGYDDLATVGGVEPADLMFGAFDLWRRLEYGGSPFESIFYDLQPGDFAGKGSRVPGAFNIPTCQWDLVQKNYARFDGSNKSKCDHYPCCKDDEGEQ